MNDDYRSQLIQRRNLLKKIIKNKQTAVENYPAGRLRISQSNGRTQYFLRTSPKDWNGTYIRKDNQILANKLAQKDYDCKVIKSARNELSRIEALIKQYEEEPIELIYDKMSEARQKLVSPVTLNNKQYIALWQAKSYDKKGFHEDAPEYYTVKGERVRSKSEILIADSLFRRQIPYRYEYPLVLQRIGTIHPDFMVLNVRLRKEYYWEHLGMMDNMQYAESALNRIVHYEKNGYFPGSNLIITHETSNSPISTTIIESVISHYLI